MKLFNATVFLTAAIILYAGFCLAEELRILCWEGYAPSENARKFETMMQEKYGMDITVRVTDVSDPQEFFTMIRAKKVDLISPAQNIPRSDRWKFIEGHLVLPVDLKNVPNYRYVLPSLQRADYITVDETVYGVPIVYGVYGLAYNAAFFEKPPESWNVLWNPEYEKKYSISSDYHEANIYCTALALGISQEELFNYDTLNTNKDMESRLRSLARNAAAFWVGVDRAEDLNGLALATAWGFSFSKLREQGEIWKFAEPVEGTTGWVDNWLIGYSLKDSPEMKRIAEEWINYSIGEEMQVNYVKTIGQFPVNLSIKKGLTPAEVETYHLDDPDYLKKNIILWKTLPVRYQNGFKSMWEKAKK